MTLDEMIAVLQAAKRGGAIQWRYRGELGAWQDDAPVWNFRSCDYRVKPKPPKPLEGWVNFYGDFSLGNRFHPTKDEANATATSDCLRCVHVREVEE